MSDIFQLSSKWLAETLRTHASRTVRYRRGGQEITLPAVVGRTPLAINDEAGGVRMEWTDRDFLIAPQDLVFHGTLASPQRGDVIIEEDRGTVYRYEVHAMGNEPAWRWCDPHRYLMRIHTKLVAEEQP